jgi:hypothetical protein
MGGADPRPSQPSADGGIAAQGSDAAAAPSPPAGQSAHDSGIGLTPSTQPDWESWQTVALDQPTPLGVSGAALLARWEGLYQGQWDPPLGSFTVRVERSNGMQVQFRRRYDAIAGSPGAGVDGDGDGIVDGSIEVKLQLDVELTTADGGLRLTVKGLDIVASSPARQTLGHAFAFAALAPALPADLADRIGITDACDSGVLGLTWSDADGDRITMAIAAILAPRTTCRAYRSAGLMKSALP